MACHHTPGTIWDFEDLPDELLREVVKALLDHLRLRAVLAPVEKSTIGALEVQIEGDE